MTDEIEHLCPFFIRLNLLGSVGVWKNTFWLWVLVRNTYREYLLMCWCVAFNPFNSISKKRNPSFLHNPNDRYSWWGLWVLNKSACSRLGMSSEAPLSYLWPWWLLSPSTEEWWGVEVKTHSFPAAYPVETPFPGIALSFLLQPGHQTTPHLHAFCSAGGSALCSQEGLLCIPVSVSYPGSSTCT